MDEFQMQTYGDRIADVYDEIYAHVSTPAVIEPMLDVLADLAGEARALELGIGTGRVALPLARRGVEVHGIESSESMVTRLREKPGGLEIPITLGDLVDAGVGGRIRTGLRGLQYVLCPADPGSPGRVFPECRPKPGLRRRVLNRGLRAGPFAVRSRTEHPGRHRGDGPHLHRPDQA